MSLTQPNRPAYDAIADWYAEWVDRESWAHPTLLRRLLPLTGDVSGCRVADIGCGEGWFSRVLARAGATVVGIDISEAMLERARARTDGGMAITYVRDDAQVLGTIGDNECDGAISMLALMDIPDLAATFRAIHRAVVHGGWLVIGITHPCFYGPQASWSDDERRTHRMVSTYLTEGRWVSTYAPGIRARVGAWHRTIGTYLNTAREAGWELETLLEPKNLTHEGEVSPLGTEIPGLLLARFRARPALESSSQPQRRDRPTPADPE